MLGGVVLLFIYVCVPEGNLNWLFKGYLKQSKHMLGGVS